MRILLITPPFVQTNTPYPAIPYLKQLLSQNGFNTTLQVDLSLEVQLRIFSREGLIQLFDQVSQSTQHHRIVKDRRRYEDTIDAVIEFMQGGSRSMSHRIAAEGYLPLGERMLDEEEGEWAFGLLSIEDRARYIASLYLENLVEFIRETVDPDYGFSRYAENLGRCASSFDSIEIVLNEPPRFTDLILFESIETATRKFSPEVVLITVPFPGNLYSTLRICEWMRKHYPNVKIGIGGGFVNTELRRISDTRPFAYWDALLYDDAEDSLIPLLRYWDGKEQKSALVRTALLDKHAMQVVQIGMDCHITLPDEPLYPNYSDLPLDRYISLFERLNPMHRLWSDGRWNKLMLAHGCYWAKCSFCDVSLDYIGRYQANKIDDLIRQMEQLVRTTGEHGFHFVDEAAPPKLLEALSRAIIDRGLQVVWWANVRFEKSFTAELCRLMHQAGCIAVSGGLEVASDRILRLINKGVTIEQVAHVAQAFSDSGILVHAYLMYGFPTQTSVETIDSLEVVRQLFELGLIQSGFWHRFALTAHSPIGLNPEQFSIHVTELPFGGFAENDLSFNDPTGADPELFAEGLRISLYNYMNGVGFDLPLSKWFSSKVPATTLPPNYIRHILSPKSKKRR